MITLDKIEDSGVFFSKSLDSDSRHVLTIPRYALWRFSRRQLSDFNLLGFSSPSQEKDTVISSLKNANILNRLNDLSGGVNGNRFTLLLERLLQDRENISSNDRRALSYASQLLFSIHLKNDTGKKGSLNICDLVGDKESINHNLEGITELDKNKFTLKRSNTKTQSTDTFLSALPTELKDDQYTFRFDTKERITLDLITKRKIEEITSLVAKSFRNNNPSNTQFAVTPFSIDFLLSKENIKVLEVHCPPRGIGMMYLPFKATNCLRHSTPDDIYVDAILRNYKKHFKDPLTNIALCYPFKESTFINRDIGRLAKILSKKTSAKLHIVSPYRLKNRSDERIHVMDKNVVPELIIFSDIPESYKQYYSNSQQLVVPSVDDAQLCEKRELLDGISEDHKIPFIEINKDETPMWNEITESIGRLVVVKEAEHRPWWSGQKEHCRFYDLKNEKHQKLVRKRLYKSDIRIEKLISNSVDELGHFGELRVFGFIETKS